MIAVFLTGYSYIQAAHLYAEASRSAAHAPELARGLSPLDGILVPTMGALYLVVTLLYPFVVIRTVSAEKQSGALKLILQLPYSTSALLAAKLVAVVVAWAVLLLPSLIAFGLWTQRVDMSTRLKGQTCCWATCSMRWSLRDSRWPQRP